MDCDHAHRPANLDARARSLDVDHRAGRLNAHHAVRALDADRAVRALDSNATARTADAETGPHVGRSDAHPLHRRLNSCVAADVGGGHDEARLPGRDRASRSCIHARAPVEAERRRRRGGEPATSHAAVVPDANANRRGGDVDRRREDGHVLPRGGVPGEVHRVGRSGEGDGQVRVLDELAVHVVDPRVDLVAARREELHAVVADEDDLSFVLGRLEGDLGDAGHPRRSVVDDGEHDRTWSERDVRRDASEVRARVGAPHQRHAGDLAVGGRDGNFDLRVSIQRARAAHDLNHAARVDPHLGGDVADDHHLSAVESGGRDGNHLGAAFALLIVDRHVHVNGPGLQRAARGPVIGALLRVPLEVDVLHRAVFALHLNGELGVRDDLAVRLGDDPHDLAVGARDHLDDHVPGEHLSSPDAREHVGQDVRG